MKDLKDISPLRLNLVVRQDALDNTTKSGLVISTNRDRNNKPSTGTVVTVGDECKYLSAGDKVVFSKYSGVFFEYNGEKDLLLMTESEILGKINNDKSKINVGDTPIYRSTEIGASQLG